MDWACGQDGCHKECIQNFGGETSWKRLHSRPRKKWKNNMKMSIREWDRSSWNGNIKTHLREVISNIV
jgi:hypothetical protein